MTSNSSSSPSSSSNSAPTMTNSASSSNIAPIYLLSNICNLITTKLDTSNYVLWRFQITSILKAHGLFGLVDGTYSRPSRFIEGSTQENPDYINWCTQDQAVMTLLNASLSARALSYVVGYSSSGEIWLGLEESFSPRENGGKQKNYDAENYDSFMDSMKERLNNKKTTSGDWSIFRVPRRLRELNEDAYSPRVVSIGPFHWGNKELQPMEVHKTSYMESLLQRTPETQATFAECCKNILRMEKDARDCYYEFSENTGSKKMWLAEILLVDGCFILELFLRWYSSLSRNSTENTNDPIFGNSWMIDCLQRDLALLENQIPMFVLGRLFDLIIRRIPKHPPWSLNEFCIRFFHSMKLNWNEEAEADSEASYRCSINIGTSNGGRHLLDVIRNSYLPSFQKKDPKRKHSWEFIHSVTKLSGSGIKFVKGKSDNLFHIKFNCCKGVLKIPRLYIQDSTDSLLRNLIAFEQCCEGMSHHITSYTLLMDRLIDSPQDAELLEQSGVIANYLGNGEDVSNLFNNLCKQVVVKDFFFAALCEQVDNYYSSWLPQNIAVLKRDYCSNPCTTISFLAAAVLLLLTVVQAGYSIASYY